MNRNLLGLKCCFAPRIGQALERGNLPENINEIRLRTGRPVGILHGGKERFLTEKGSLTDFPDMCSPVSREEMEFSFRAVCDYSVHSFSRELAEGFITLEGGNRVGICGTAVTENGRVVGVKYVSGLDFRITGQAYGCAEGVCGLFEKSAGGMLIIGPPMSGKTTVVRDMCRILGRRHRVSVIDERGEIGAVFRGVPQNDTGPMTDIFDGYPKAEGIITAVRVMSPEIVVCDEIGGREDCEAVLSSASSGVRFIATAHGSGLSDIMKRKYLSDVAQSGIFGSFVTLEGLGRIKSVEKGAGL